MRILLDESLGACVVFLRGHRRRSGLVWLPKRRLNSASCHPLRHLRYGGSESSIPAKPEHLTDNGRGIGCAEQQAGITARARRRITRAVGFHFTAQSRAVRWLTLPYGQPDPPAHALIFGLHLVGAPVTLHVRRHSSNCRKSARGTDENSTHRRSQ